MSATTRPLIALAAVLVVGFAVAFLLRPSDPATEPGVGATTSIIEPEAEAEAPAATLAAAEVAQGEAVERRSADRVEAPEAPAAEAAPEIESPSRVLGRVVGPDGAPIAGAALGFVRGSGGLTAMLGRRQPSVEGRSDELGAFELEVEDGERGALRVAAPGHVTRVLADLAPNADEPIDVGEVVLETAALLEGRVVDEGGAGIAGAELRLVANSSDPFAMMRVSEQETAAVTDAAGRFRIDRAPIGPWSLRVDSDVHPPGVFDGETTRDLPRSTGLEFGLARGDTIRGVVDGIPDDRRDSLAVVTTRAERVDVPERRQVNVAADGSFTVRGLSVGESYQLGLTTRQPDGRAPLFLDFGSLSDRVVARSGDVGVRLAFLPGARLELQVVDAGTDEPIEEFDVRYEQGWSNARLENLLADEDGRAPEGRAAYEDVRAVGEFEDGVLKIDATGYEPYELELGELAAGEERDLGQVQLTPVGVLAVRVRDGDGAPVESARVTVQPTPEPMADGSFTFSVRATADGDGEEEIQIGGNSVLERTDAEGVARFSAVMAGPQDVVVRADGFAETKLTGIELSAGEELVVDLERGGTLVIDVVDAEGEPVPGARVERRRGGEATSDLVSGLGMALNGAGPVRADAQGRVVLPNVPTGLHQVRIAPAAPTGTVVMMAGASTGPDDDEWLDVEVADGGRHEVVLVAPTTSTLSGRVLEAGEPLAGATVRVSEAGEPSFGGFMMGGGPSARTDADGEFSIPGLDFGEYELTIEHPRRAMPSKSDLTLTERQERFDVDLAVTIVRGRVLDADGNPVEGASVTAEAVQEDDAPRVVMLSMVSVGGGTVVSSDGGTGPEPTRSGPDGLFELRGVASERPLQIVVDAPMSEPSRSEELELDAGEAREGVEVLLQRAGAIALSVTDPSGAPAGMALVRAEYIGDDEEVPPRVEFVQASGELELDGLRPGPWTITLEQLGGSQTEQVDNATVDVVAGERLPLTLTKP